MRTNAWSEALDLYTTLLEVKPRRTDVLLGLGRCLERLDRPEEAAITAEEAVRRFPDDVVARAALAEALRALGALPEAEALYRETIDLFPEDAAARIGLGTLLANSGRLDEGEAVLRTAPEDEAAASPPSRTNEPGALQRISATPPHPPAGCASTVAGWHCTCDCAYW
jgi:Flp pilus assembly protein TadD